MVVVCGEEVEEDLPAVVRRRYLFTRRHGGGGSGSGGFALLHDVRFLSVCVCVAGWC